jgi:predicted MFS family arabinose efflux permease
MANGTAKAERPRSAWAVFQSWPYSKIWTASMLGLSGIAMSDAATAWLMTSLNADPRAVSAVQVAAFLPMFMFTLPAGAIVDIVEPKRFLLALEIFITALVAVIALVVSLNWSTPALLLSLTFVLSAAWSVAAPAWAALMPSLVPRRDLEAAAAFNAISYNVSRIVGPALAGRLIAALGVAAPFWGFAFANTASVVTLAMCRSAPRREATLPAEPFVSALRTGLRHAIYNPHLRATLMRTVAVFPFGAAFLALLPLVARNQMDSGPQAYGLLLALASLGGVAGSLMRPYAKYWLGADRFVAASTLTMALSLALCSFCGFAPWMAFLATFLAGASWTTLVASLSLSAQVSLPDWVRGRGLAIFLTVVFGSISVGSFAWGSVAANFGLSTAQLLAAAGAIVGVPLSWPWRLQTAEGVDLTPSRHWQAPVLAREVEDDSGPVLITVRYRLARDEADSFLDAVEKVGDQRRRDGAYAWGVFADVAEKGVYLETFLIGSWLEARYLRERVTEADRLRENQLKALLAEPPSLTLMLYADAPKPARAHTADLALALTTSQMPA